MDPIFTLATIPAILALVQFCKELGLPGKGAMLLSLLLGVGLNVLDFYFTDLPLYQAIVGGVLLGLAAAGVYDTAKITNPATE